MQPLPDPPPSQLTDSAVMDEQSSFQIDNSEKFTLSDLEKLLIGNSSNKLFILKFSATWCGPCKRIKTMAEEKMAKLMENHIDKVVCANIDIDDNMDLYGQLKTKKVVKGVPAILAYMGTEMQDPWYYPFDSVSGGNIDNIENFFSRCEKKIE